MKELFEVCKEGNLEKVKELLKAGANVNAKDSLGKTPLYWAAEEGHLEIVKYLIESGT